MSDSEELTSLNEESEEESLPANEPTKKRQKSQAKVKTLKKVKYENISEKPNKKRKNDLYKPPTVEELNQLKETENLYNNMLFRLQIEEIVKEIKIKTSYINIFNKFVQNFKSLMEELPEFKINTSKIKKSPSNVLTKEQKLIADLVHHMPSHLGSEKSYDLKLRAPEGFEIFGLYKLESLPGPNLTVNIYLKLPRAYFQVKDYLNNIYFTKRQYYLIYILHFLKKTKIYDKISFELHEHNQNLSILRITPKEDANVFVNIYATPPDNFFKLSRCLPNINNYRINGDEGENLATTPLYNAILGYDLTLRENNQFIENTLQGLHNCKEAIKLLRIWLLQRDLDECLTEDLVIYFVIYLILKQKVNKFMSSYQVIRNFWSFFCETDLTEGYITISESVLEENLADYKKYYDIVFFDRTGYYNVTAFLSRDHYTKIKLECELAFKLLDESGLVSFQHLFTNKLPLELQFDIIISIDIPLNDDMTSEEYLRYYPFNRLREINKIIAELKRGLNKRVTCIWPFPNKVCPHWDSHTFGINLDEGEAYSVLEKGPHLNDPFEKKFRDFWGSLSSDRRFKDGSMHVAVHFPVETMKDRRDIIKKIISHVLKKRLELEYKIFFNDLEEEMLVNKNIKTPYPTGTNEEGCLKAILISDELNKVLRGLKLPLAITGIQGISDVFSFTDPTPPIAATYEYNKLFSNKFNSLIFKENVTSVEAPYLQPIEFVLKLEHSSKWPQSLEGIKKMKTGFYLEISQKLNKNHNILCSVKTDFLDVFYEGLVFRYYIYVNQEVGLMKKTTLENGLTAYHDTAESLEMVKKFDVLPKITGALKGLQAQYPTFGPATAMVKRWLRAQLIDDYLFPDMAINLTMAAIYLNCGPFKKSASIQLSFLRWLKFILDLQVELQPVIVNFNDSIPNDVLAETDKKMMKNRDSFPYLYIITPFDNYKSIFTKTSPKKEIFGHVKRLADGTLTYLYNVLRNTYNLKIDDLDIPAFPFSVFDIDYLKLVVPNMKGFDLVINIKQKVNSRKREDIFFKEITVINIKPYEKSKNPYVPIVNFNPIQLYLDELRKNYGQYALFFHNTYGGSKIGVIWTPLARQQMNEPTEFKLGKVAGHKQVNGKMVLNLGAIIEDFSILGQGLIASIKLKDSNNDI